MRILGWVLVAVMLGLSAPADALIGNDGSTVKSDQKAGAARRAAPAMENAAPGRPAAAVAPAKAKRKVKPAKRVKKPRAKATPKP